MPWSHKAKKLAEYQRRLELHWKSMLYQQAAAYAIVLFLWVFPIPNPVKVLAVTFHEISHAIAAILTGGSVFGFAVAPDGAGATFGLGGNFFLILIAGYLGSSLSGVFLYVMSVRWQPQPCLIALQFFVLATAALGWLNSYTVWFGVGSLAAMTALLWTPSWVQVFFVRLVGSACCCYAPLEVVGDLFKHAAPPSVMGFQTKSDLTQLAELTGLPAAVVMLLLLALQAALLIFVIRWTCNAGARAELRRENLVKKLIRVRRQELRQIRGPEPY